MKLFFDMLLVLTLLTCASSTLTYLKQSRSGLQTIPLTYALLPPPTTPPTPPSPPTPSLSTAQYTITFDYFIQQTFTNLNVLIGINSFQNVVCSTHLNSLKTDFLSATASGFKIKVDHMYLATSKGFRIFYFAYTNGQNYFDFEIIRLSTGTFYQNRPLVPTSVRLTWISGYQFMKLAAPGIDIRAFVEQPDPSFSNFRLEVEWDNTKIILLSVEVHLFQFSQDLIASSVTGMASWGWIDQTGNSYSPSLPANTYFIAVNTLSILDPANFFFKTTNLTSYYQISTTSANHAINYTYFNFMSDCKVTCYRSPTSAWPMCDKKYLKIDEFDACHCPRPHSLFFTGIDYYCWHQCMEIPYLYYKNAVSECECITDLGECDATHPPECQPTRCYYLAKSGDVRINTVNKDPARNVILFTGQSALEHSVYTDGANFENILEFQIENAVSLSNWRYHPNGTFSGELTYYENVHGSQLISHIHLSRLQHTLFGYNIFQFSRTYTDRAAILPENALLAYAYSESIYIQAEIIQYVVYGMVCVAGVNAVLALANRYSIVVLEMLSVVQLSYFALPLAGSYRSPLIMPLRQLRYFNGFNLQLPASSTPPPNLYLSNVFIAAIENVNLMTALLLLPLLVSLLCFAMSKIHTSQALKYQTIFKSMLGQYILIVLLFLTCSQSFSLGIMLTSYQQITSPIILISSWVQSGVFFATLLVMIILFPINNYNLFGQFKYAMMSAPFPVNFYYLIPIAEKIVISFCLGYMNTSYKAGVVGIVLSFVCGVAVLILKPYAERYSNQRFALNHLAQMLIFSCYIYLNFKEETTDVLALYLPYAIITFDILCLAASFTLTIRRTKINILDYIEEQNSIQNRIVLERKEAQINQQLMKTLEEGMSIKSNENYTQRILYKRLVKKTGRGKKHKSIEDKMGEIDGKCSSCGDEEEGLTPRKIKMVSMMLENDLI